MERQAIADFAEALRRSTAIARARHIGEEGEDDRARRMRVGRGEDSAGLEVDRPIGRLAVERPEDRLEIAAREPARNFQAVIGVAAGDAEAPIAVKELPLGIRADD